MQFSAVLAILIWKCSSWEHLATSFMELLLPKVSARRLGGGDASWTKFITFTGGKNQDTIRYFYWQSTEDDAIARASACFIKRNTSLDRGHSSSTAEHSPCFVKQLVGEEQTWTLGNSIPDSALVSLYKFKQIITNSVSVQLWHWDNARAGANTPAKTHPRQCDTLFFIAFSLCCCGLFSQNSAKALLHSHPSQQNHILSPASTKEFQYTSISGSVTHHHLKLHHTATIFSKVS